MPHPLEHRARAARAVKLPNSLSYIFPSFLRLLTSCPSGTGRSRQFPILQVNLKPGKLRKNLTWLVDKRRCSSYIDPAARQLGDSCRERERMEYLLLIISLKLAFVLLFLWYFLTWFVRCGIPGTRKRKDWLWFVGTNGQKIIHILTCGMRELGNLSTEKEINRLRHGLERCIVCLVNQEKSNLPIDEVSLAIREVSHKRDSTSSLIEAR